MEETLRIQVINVSGTHMIVQGTAGFSRALITESIILLSELDGTKNHLASGRDEEGDVGSYIIIVLMGILKGEMG